MKVYYAMTRSSSFLTLGPTRESSQVGTQIEVDNVRSYETQREMELLVLRNLESAVDGKGLLTPVCTYLL
jgi:hypothetical protein